MVEDDWVATLLRNRYRDDFIVEPPLAPCRRGALVRPHGIGVRLLARNSEIARHILSGFDHSRDDAIALDRLRHEPSPRQTVVHFDAAEPRALANRSEEHTSELQSLMRISYAVFCLKKKTKTQ